MATATLNDHPVTGDWVNICATLTAASGVDVSVQNNGGQGVQVVFGGASAPTGKTGLILGSRDVVTGNATQIWVRGAGGLVTVNTL